MITITITTAAELETLKQFLVMRSDETMLLIDDARKDFHEAKAIDRLMRKVAGVSTARMKKREEALINIKGLWVQFEAYWGVLDEIKAYKETGLDISESPLTLCFESLDGLTRGGQ